MMGRSLRNLDRNQSSGAGTRAHQMTWLPNIMDWGMKRKVLYPSVLSHCRMNMEVGDVYQHIQQRVDDDCVQWWKKDEHVLSDSLGQIPKLIGEVQKTD